MLLYFGTTQPLQQHNSNRVFSLDLYFLQLKDTWMHTDTRLVLITPHSTADRRPLLLAQFAQNCIGARIFSRWHRLKCNHMGSAGSCRSGHLLCEFGPDAKMKSRESPPQKMLMVQAFSSHLCQSFGRHARRGSVKTGPFVSAVTPDGTPCH